MTTLKKKSDKKIAKIEKSPVKIVAGTFCIFCEVQKNTFEIQDVTQLTADVTAIVGKLFCYVSLKRRDFTKISLTL